MERAIEIGKLDKRITFQKQVLTLDEMGQDKHEWKDFKTVWAEFYPVRSGEYREADQKKREETVYKANVRYIPGIDASLRIRFRDRLFLIDRAVNVDEANYKLEIECTEYVEKESGKE